MQDCVRYKKPSMINLLEFDEFPSDFNLNRQSKLEDIIID